MHPKASLSLRLFFLLCLFSIMGIGRAQAVPPQQEQSPLAERLYSLTSYEGLETLPLHSPENVSGEPQAPNLALEPWQQVAFESFRDLDWEIYLLDGSGSQKRITSSAGVDIHPRMARGCDRVYFASKRTGNYDIFAMHPDGSGLAQLTTSRKDDVYPIPSPDGTRILFQSYRQGKADLYLMNADGTGQVPLTKDGIYNGMPSWSPDGSKIAFISRRSGGFFVHVINADGSGLTQLSSQMYSYYPIWSPDGRQIAYGADSDKNSWIELWVMNADGSGQSRLMRPANYSDLLSRSWSPDGRYIGFTNVSYEYIGGAWYWTTAYLSYWDKAKKNSGNIIENAAEWNPDWQTIDIAPPATAIQLLQGTSPSPVVVSWPGSDVGPAGIWGYDVQVKDGPEGAWVDWLAGTLGTRGSFLGISGHTYYFRVRATDRSFNTSAWSAETGAFTRIESAPPRTSVKPLPAYRRSGSLIEWQGVDPGDSGILSYDVQYRDTGGGAWVDWLVGTEQTSAIFTGDPGHTYAFRSRGKDRAQNLESWPAGGGDAVTRLCQWAAIGKIVDQTGNPVSGAKVTISPGLPGGVLSEKNGDYAACISQSAATYTVSLEKAGYGSLPSTSYSSQADVPAIFTLPPEDNLVADGGFESGILEGNWQSGGDWAPMLAAEPHSGQFSVQFSPGQDTVYSTVQFPYAGSPDPTTRVLLDSQDLPQLVIPYDKLDFMKRGPDGQWSAPETLPESYNASLVQALIDDHDNVHVLWRNYGPLYGLVYSVRDRSGKWSSPVLLCSNPWWFDHTADMVLDRDGTLHFAWIAYENSTTTLFYVQRDAFGAWSRTIVLNPEQSSSVKQIMMQADEVGGIHMSWLGDHSVYYMNGSASGKWGLPETIYSEYRYEQLIFLRMAINDAGGVMLVWTMSGVGQNSQGEETYEDRVMSSYRDEKGDWSTPGFMPAGIKLFENGIGLVMDQERRAHLILAREGEYAIRHILWSTATGWGTEETLGEGSQATFVLEKQQNLYAFWVSPQGVNYRKWDPAGHWQPAHQLPDTQYIQGIAVDQNEYSHLAWQLDRSERIVTYFGPRTAHGGETSLSQTFTIPAGGPPAILSFLFKIVAPDGHFDGEHNWFDVRVEAGGHGTTLRHIDQTTDGWIHAWADLSPWAGQTITLIFTSHVSEGAYPFFAYIDNVSVGAAHPDVGVSAWSVPAGVKPGEQVQVRLSVGNRGLADASHVTITATLPGGLSLVSASLPPTAQGNTLVWSLDQLPARGELVITLTALVDASAPPGSQLSIPVVVAAPGELETGNNTTTAITYLGSLIYIPSIWKD